MATCPLFGMPMVAGIVRVSCPKGSGFAVYYVYLALHCIDPGHQAGGDAILVHSVHLLFWQLHEAVTVLCVLASQPPTRCQMRFLEV